MPKVYLETTLFYFYFADTGSPFYGKTVDYWQDTRRFFDAVRNGYFEPYTSIYVIQELRKTGNATQKDSMMKLIEDFGVVVLQPDRMVKRLAWLYISGGAVPETQLLDAYHIAATAVHGLDLIVSLNFRHIVNEKAGRIIAEINADEGLDAIEILEPGEVLNEWT